MEYLMLKFVVQSCSYWILDQHKNANFAKKNHQLIIHVYAVSVQWVKKFQRRIFWKYLLIGAGVKQYPANIAEVYGYPSQAM